MGWYAAAKGYSGFLRWAYDAWPADPLRDARHVSWPAGDCFLVYPGAASCVRLEKLREGISDYEKIWILKNHATQKSAPEVRKLIVELDRILHEIADEKGYCRGKYKISSLDEILQK